MINKNEKEWNKNEIEKLSCCPICKSKKYKKIFGDLKDKVFFCAPGKWNLFKCSECTTIFLDPRPNEKSRTSTNTCERSNGEKSGNNVDGCGP